MAPPSGGGPGRPAPARTVVGRVCAHAQQSWKHQETRTLGGGKERHWHFPGPRASAQLGAAGKQGMRASSTSHLASCAQQLELDMRACSVGVVCARKVMLQIKRQGAACAGPRTLCLSQPL